MTVALRRAEPRDVPFLVELANDPEVEPFLAPVRAKTAEALAAEIARSDAEPETFGRFVIEWEGEPAGMVGFDCYLAHHRIANVGGLAVASRFRGRGVAERGARALVSLLLDELGYHRLQLECYGFNEVAIRSAERVGFVREGVRRKAYWRHGAWQDGVMFGLVTEDLVDRDRADRAAAG